MQYPRHYHRYRIGLVVVKLRLTRGSEQEPQILREESFAKQLWPLPSVRRMVTAALEPILTAVKRAEMRPPEPLWVGLSVLPFLLSVLRLVQ